MEELPNISLVTILHNWSNFIKSFKDKSNEVLQEMVDKDPKSKKIFDAYEDFRVKFKDWSVVSDKIYYEL